MFSPSPPPSPPPSPTSSMDQDDCSSCSSYGSMNELATPCTSTGTPLRLTTLSCKSPESLNERWNSANQRFGATTPLPSVRPPSVRPSRCSNPHGEMLMGMMDDDASSDYGRPTTSHGTTSHGYPLHTGHNYPFHAAPHSPFAPAPHQYHPESPCVFSPPTTPSHQRDRARGAASPCIFSPPSHLRPFGQHARSSPLAIPSPHSALPPPQPLLPALGTPPTSSLVSPLGFQFPPSTTHSVSSSLSSHHGSPSLHSGLHASLMFGTTPPRHPLTADYGSPLGSPNRPSSSPTTPTRKRAHPSPPATNHPKHSRGHPKSNDVINVNVMNVNVMNVNGKIREQGRFNGGISLAASDW